MDAVDLPHNFLQTEDGEELIEDQLTEHLPEQIRQEDEQAIEYGEWVVEEVAEQTSKYLIHEEQEAYVDFSHEEHVYLEEDVEFFDNHPFEERYPEEENYEDESVDQYDYQDDETIPIVEMTKRKATIVECEYCGLVIKHPSKIRAHMRTHTGEKPFQCTLCGSRFSQKVPMLNHMRKHVGDTPYQCDFCEKRFVNGAQKRAHELRHQGIKRRGPPRPQLKPPRRKLLIPSTSTISIKRDAGKPPSVEWDPPFGQIRQPLSPAASKRLDEIIEAVASGANEKKKRKSNSSRSVLLAQCNVCGLMLRHPSKVQEHMRTHTGEKPYGCSVCGIRFARMYSLKMHMGRKHADNRKIMCAWECGAQFVSVGVKNEHERVVHTGAKRYMCTVADCQRMFARRSSLMKHRMNDHPGLHKPLFDPHEVNSAEEMDNQTESPVKSVYLNDEILSHEEVEKLLDMPERTLLIEEETHILEGEFMDDEEECLSLHMYKSEEDIATDFIDYRNLEDGQILEDIGTESLVDVDGTLIQSTNRYDYVKLDSGEYIQAEVVAKRRYRMKQRTPAQIHYCSVCNKTFKYPSKIQEHMRKHTGEKPFLCTTCGARFSQGHVLKAHIRTHEGEKPFKCSYCDRCFATTTHRNTHEKTSHHEEFQNGARNRPCTSRDSEETEEAICYGCPFEDCGFQSPNRTEVEEHLELHYEVGPEEEIEEGSMWDEFSADLHQESQQLIGDYQVYTVDERSPAAHIEHIVEEAHSSTTQTLGSHNGLQSTSTIVEDIEVESSHPSYELQVAPLKKEDLEMIMEQYPMGINYDNGMYEGEEGGTIRMLVDPRPPKRGKPIDPISPPRAVVDLDIRTFEMVKPKPETIKPVRKRTKAPRNLDWIIDAVAKGHDVSLSSPHNRKKPTIHKCQYCGKVDKYPSKIEAHMRTHTGEKPFKCEICGMSFSQRTPMRLHMRRHLQEKPYPCPVEGCDEAFVSGALRNQHFSKKHLKEKKYVCMKGCGRYFASCKNQRVHEEKCTYSRNLEDDPIFQQLLYEQNHMDDDVYDVEESNEVHEKNWEHDSQLLEGEGSALPIEETYVDEMHVEHEEEYIENTCET